ncbi:hypothetical protein [Demequina sp. NBRC 110056]|uniref:hypothetical protein n=1 Tax=Demequina sp. NBRC 110056 TaxID=1570345 RepID=UPI00117C2CF1|nr:hypothetical protein [Demequina sp. NBRC 110056]
MTTNDNRHHAKSGISRRRVLVGTAWATPAVMIGAAAPQAAASGGSASPLAGATITQVASNGTHDALRVTVALPQGASLTNVSVVVLWVPDGNKPHVKIPAWNSPEKSSGNDTFTRASVGAGDTFDIEFFKAADNSQYTVTISGTTQGGASASRSFTGTLL